MNKLIVLIIALFHLSLPVLSQDNIDWEKNFKPHMVDHLNEGCPSNSECTAELGKKRKAWEDLFKTRPTAMAMNALAKTIGFPLKIWNDKNSSKEDYISWNSPCEVHNIEGQEIRTAEIFIKSPLKNKDHALFHKIYMENGDKVREYIIPRDETPLYKDGNDLVFLLEEKGHYFGMRINEKNEYSLIKNPSTQHFSELISCPKILQDYFDKNVHKDLYRFSNCKALWNDKTKKYETFIVGKACS